MATLSENLYRAPGSDVDNFAIPISKTFSTLSIATKIFLIIAVVWDCLIALLFIQMMALSGNGDVAFVIVLLNLSLATMLYKAATSRRKAMAWLACVLHLVPGFNIVGFVLSVIVALFVTREAAMLRARS